MLDERVHNYPQGYEKKPWCPQSKLIQVCADLVGIELTPDNFCTQIQYDNEFGGPYHGLISAHFLPAASCSKLNCELFQQLKLVREKDLLTPNEVIDQELNAAIGFEAKKAVIDKYTPERQKSLEKQKILTRWRKVIFETTVATAGDENNQHFRQFKSADELSENEILHKVDLFKTALLKIVGHEENTGYLSGVVDNCPQAPKRDIYFAPADF